MKFFCDEVKPIFALAGFNGGYLFAKNNPKLKASAVEVVDGIQKAIESGQPIEVLNALLKEAAMEYIEKLSDPLVKMNAMAVLSMLNLKVDGSSVEMPVFKAEEIKAILSGFKNGMAAIA